MKFTLKLPIILAFTFSIAFIAVTGNGCSTTTQQVSSPGGIVNIVNQSSEKIEIYVDGSRTTVIEPGQREKVDRLLSGTRALRAVGMETGAETEKSFDLKIGEAVGWNIDGFGEGKASGRELCSLDVRNLTNGTLNVVVGDAPPVSITSGTKTRIKDLDVGTAMVTATTASTGGVRAAEVELRPDVVPLLTFVDGRGAVRFHNRSGRLAMIAADGVPATQVPDGQSFTFIDLDEGTALFSAVDIGRRTLGVFSVDVRRGQTVDVIINQPEGVLNVISDIDVPINIFADGVLLGSCPASGGATFKGLVIGNNNLKAVRGNNQVVARTWMEIKPETNLWLIGEASGTMMQAGTGSIEVVSTAREKLDLYVDGNMSGVILPKATRVVTNLPPGKHSAAVLGNISRSLVTSEITVRDGKKAKWTVTMPAATLAVRNSGDETVNVYSDGRHLGTVESGADKAFAVAQGEHRIEVSGVKSMNGVIRTMVLPAGTTTTVPYSGPLATVVATNMFKDPVEIRINERVIGILAHGERVTVSDINPGVLRLTADSTERPVNVTVMVDLAAGDAFDWNITP